MKIVFFLGTFAYGGAEKHALLLADYYKNHLNWKTEAWAWSELDGPIPEMCEKINVKTVEVPKYKPTGFWNKINLDKTYKKFFNDVDVVMSFNNKPNIFCAEFIPKTNVKLHVWAQQGIDGYTFSKPQEKEFLKNLTLVISNSNNGYKFLRKKVGIPKEIIKVVYNGIDTNPAPRNSKAWGEKLSLPNESTFNAVMVANITKLKDHITLVKSWRKVTVVLKEYGIHANLFCAGRKDNMIEATEAEIKNQSLEDHVHILGGVSDVYNLVELMDLAILSSPSEGLPNAVLEVMLLSKPFVGTNIEGIREAVGEQNFQYLSEFKDFDGLSENILTFALDKELSSQKGADNKKWVEDTFPIQKLWKNTHSIVEEYLAK
jgi:glycosyltransferase involved in cell wall biosynthesis